jgi:hypothetical protein
MKVIRNVSQTHRFKTKQSKIFPTLAYSTMILSASDIYMIK